MPGAIAAAVLQGVLEWLPVSSEGFVFMLLLSQGADPAEALSAALSLHLGTALAAAVALRRELLRAVLWRDEGLAKFFYASVASTALTGVPALLIFEEVVLPSAHRRALLLLPPALLICVGALLYVAGRGRGRRTVGLREGLALGAVQGLAAIPGLSRSGVTVAVLLAMGVDSPTALSLSFLCGIPASVGASLLSLNSTPDPTLVALTAAVGLCAMEAFLKFASRVGPHKLALTFGAVGAGLALLSP